MKHKDFPKLGAILFLFAINMWYDSKLQMNIQAMLENIHLSFYYSVLWYNETVFFMVIFG